MRTLIAMVGMLLALSAWSQPIQRQFFTTNTNPRVIVAAGTNVTVQYTTTGPDTRTYTVNSTGGGGTQTNISYTAVTNAPWQWGSQNLTNWSQLGTNALDRGQIWTNDIDYLRPTNMQTEFLIRSNGNLIIGWNNDPTPAPIDYQLRLSGVSYNGMDLIAVDTNTPSKRGLFEIEMGTNYTSMYFGVNNGPEWIMTTDFSSPPNYDGEFYLNTPGGAVLDMWPGVGPTGPAYLFGTFFDINTNADLLLIRNNAMDKFHVRGDGAVWSSGYVDSSGTPGSLVAYGAGNRLVATNANYLTNGYPWTNIVLQYAVSSKDATNFWGQLNATNYNGGTGASGSTFLAGDGTWKTPGTGGSITFTNDVDASNYGITNLSKLLVNSGVTSSVMEATSGIYSGGTVSVLDETKGGIVSIGSAANLPANLYLNPYNSALNTNYQWELRGGPTSTSYDFQLRCGGNSNPYLTVLGPVSAGANGNIGIATNAPGYKLDVAGDIHALGSFYGASLMAINVTATATMTATNGYVRQLYATNGYTVCTQSKQVYLVNAYTNPMFVLPDASTVVGKQFTFSTTNRGATFIVTNATGTQTIADGTSLSYTNNDNGLKAVNFISDGAAWWLGSKGRTTLPCASWSCSTNTTFANVTNTITLDTTEMNNLSGIYLDNSAWYTAGVGSRMWVTNPGVYMLTFSAVWSKVGGGSANGDIWLRQNGTDLPRTMTLFTIQNATSTNCMTVNFMLPVTGVTYFDLQGASPDGSAQLQSMPAITSPFNRPACPSIIVTLNKTSD